MIISCHNIDIRRKLAKLSRPIDGTARKMVYCETVRLI